jgi:16S rRNA (uracil1498-N3)-methyltransferase
MIRLLVPAAAEGPLDTSFDVTLDGPQLHYVARVLRLRAGDALEVFDGAGHTFAATVSALGEASCTLRLSQRSLARHGRAIAVVQGLAKGDKLDLVFQKATELGASHLVAAACERSVVKLDGKADAKRARWQRIAEEAARQCRRADVPRVEGPVPVLEAPALLGPGWAVLVLDEEERAVPLSAAVMALPSERPVALVVGPEGGLSRAEVSGLVERGAVAVTLGGLVLRTETAALAGLAVLRHLDGALG